MVGRRSLRSLVPPYEKNRRTALYNHPQDGVARPSCCFPGQGTCQPHNCGPAGPRVRRGSPDGFGEGLLTPPKRLTEGLPIRQETFGRWRGSVRDRPQQRSDTGHNRGQPHNCGPAGAMLKFAEWGDDKLGADCIACNACASDTEKGNATSLRVLNRAEHKNPRR